jgi:transcriptional antiterminator RfaH
VKTFHVGWYLIYTKPRHEKKVHSYLTERSINSFLPVRKRLRTVNDRRRYVDEPLFPSYLFIYLNDLQNYYDGMDANGTLYYVKAGREMARVNESIINNIRLLADHGGDLEVSVDRFQPGQQLVISEGPLTGLSCEVVRLNGRNKILVRVQLLQRSLLMTLPSEKLVAGL